ncbi:MAG TPA: flagellar biosynthesis anti-sigma factor FlgM [Armatimonadota bacterium]|nr:flagellar biosynthesis anti-sigma factor FlgM [Armatimonadota bacterium]
MRIESTGIGSVAPGSGGAGALSRQAPAGGATGATIDDVKLSPRARMLEIARQALADTPPVRQSVVAAARAKLEAGEYTTDGRSIAEALIAAIREGA